MNKSIALFYVIDKTFKKSSEDSNFLAKTIKKNFPRETKFFIR